MTILQILSWIAPPIFWLLALFSFPKLFGSVFLKTFDHYQSRRLERLKSELTLAGANQIERVKGEMSAAYSTLISSVNFFTANQGEVRIKRLTSVEILWKAVLAIDDQFSKLIFLEIVRTPEEINEFYKDPQKDQYFWLPLKEYKEEDATMKKWEAAGTVDLQTERLYVSGRLWELFYIYRAMLGRLAWLARKSFQQKTYCNWRTDSHMLALLSSAFSNDEIQQAKNAPIQGLQILNQRFYNIFLEEAEKVISGSAALSKGIFDIQTTMIAEKDRLAADWRRPEQ